MSIVRRREFITLLGGAAAASTSVWPFMTRAQRGGRIPRVGVLWHAGSAEEEAIYLGALQQGLNGLGYIDGKTIALEQRFPNEIPERFEKMAAELAALKVDVLVAVSRPSAVAAQRATTTIPIVFVVVPDPVGTKLVNSLARPGGNITGLTHIAVELSAKRLACFKEAFPRASRAALLVNANDQVGMRRFIDEFEIAAVALGVTVKPVEVRSLGDFEAAFDKIAAERLEGCWCLPTGCSTKAGRVSHKRRCNAVFHSSSIRGKRWKRARSCPMAPTSVRSSVARLSMSTRFSKVKSPRTCRSSSRPDLSSSSISRLQGPLT
jgi:putative ABC transport system substrate-binding protein